MQWRDMSPEEIATRPEARLGGSLLYVVIVAFVLCVVMLIGLSVAFDQFRAVAGRFQIALVFVTAWSAAFVVMTALRVRITPMLASIGIVAWVVYRIFVSATGNQVTAATVGKVFHRIWDQAGLPQPAGGQQPRPYDFRHHFAYANVERWMRQGKDVTAMLSYLARYMGHASIESSYYYIHTSPDFMHAYAHITAESQSLLPEVGFE